MAKTKRKARGLELFNILFSRGHFLERPILNIYKHRAVYVGETRYKGKILGSRDATHNKARDALYGKINISVEAMMPNITVKKKKSTRVEASSHQVPGKKGNGKKRKAYPDPVCRVVDCRQKIILQKLVGGGRRNDAGPN